MRRKRIAMRQAAIALLLAVFASTAHAQSTQFHRWQFSESQDPITDDVTISFGLAENVPVAAKAFVILYMPAVAPDRCTFAASGGRVITGEVGYLTIRVDDSEPVELVGSVASRALSVMVDVPFDQCRDIIEEIASAQEQFAVRIRTSNYGDGATYAAPVVGSTAAGREMLVAMEAHYVEEEIPPVRGFTWVNRIAPGQYNDGFTAWIVDGLGHTGSADRAQVRCHDGVEVCTVSISLADMRARVTTGRVQFGDYVLTCDQAGEIGCQSTLPRVEAEEIGAALLAYQGSVTMSVTGTEMKTVVFDVQPSAIK